MNVQVDNIVEFEDKLTFNLRNVETCVVNSIRRASLSNIKTLVFKGFPHDESNIHIKKNTTNFNNEYLKHRISCIPIVNSNDSEFEQFKQSYKISLSVKNTKTNNEKIYVTTKDFEMVNKNTNKVLPKEESIQYFPPDPITGDFILICVLLPNHNTNDDNIEELTLEADFDIGCAEENSCWNVVHNSTYEFLRNETEISKKLSTIENEFDKKDYELLDAQKIYYKNEYKMSCQTLGIFTNKQIITKSCQYIVSKLNCILQYIKTNESANIQSKEEYLASSTDGTRTNDDLEACENSYCNIYKEEKSYVFELKEDDYTIGKLVEIYLYKYYENELEFVGFKKVHPIQPGAYIYIRFKKQNVSNQTVFYYLMETAKSLINLFQEIQSQFNNN